MARPPFSIFVMTVYSQVTPCLLKSALTSVGASSTTFFNHKYEVRKSMGSVRIVGNADLKLASIQQEFFISFKSFSQKKSTSNNLAFVIYPNPFVELNYTTILTFLIKGTQEQNTPLKKQEGILHKAVKEVKKAETIISSLQEHHLKKQERTINTLCEVLPLLSCIFPSKISNKNNKNLT
jgi:hypothetical protein